MIFDRILLGVYGQYRNQDGPVFDRWNTDKIVLNPKGFPDWTLQFLVSKKNHDFLRNPNVRILGKSADLYST